MARYLNIFTLTFVLFLATSIQVVQATPASDEIFLDEGDGDFEATPKVVQGDASAANEAKPVAIESAPVKPAAAKSDVAKKTEAKKTEAKSQVSKNIKPETTPRKPASSAGAFIRTTKECPLLSEPSESASQLSSVRAAKKVWSEKVSRNWYKVYVAGGTAAYLSDGCVK